MQALPEKDSKLEAAIGAGDIQLSLSLTGVSRNKVTSCLLLCLPSAFSSSMQPLVLVTGVSRKEASHCLLHCLPSAS